MTLAGQPQYLTARENNVWLLGKDHWKSDLGAGGDFFTFGNFFLTFAACATFFSGSSPLHSCYVISAILRKLY